MYDSSVTIEGPVAATRPHDQSWSYYGEPEGLASARAADQVTGRNPPVMDLRDLDVARMYTNVARALDELEVSDAVVHWIDVELDASTELPTVSIWVTNDYEESAWMETTLGGHVLEEWPYRP